MPEVLLARLLEMFLPTGRTKFFVVGLTQLSLDHVDLDLALVVHCALDPVPLVGSRDFEVGRVHVATLEQVCPESDGVAAPRPCSWQLPRISFPRKRQPFSGEVRVAGRPC